MVGDLGQSRSNYNWMCQNGGEQDCGSEEEAAPHARYNGENRSPIHGTPFSFLSAVSKSARISRSRASRAAFSRWRVRSLRQLAEQTVWRPVRATAWQTGHRRRDPTTGVRTVFGGTWRSGVASDTDQTPGVPGRAVACVSGSAIA